MSAISSTTVLLKCIKEKNRLRIRILTPGYFNNANCRFPKNIRKEGLLYSCPENNIKLAGTGRSHYYIVKNDNIKIITDAGTDAGAAAEAEVGKIFGDDDEKECVICLSNIKTHVFAPCGHYVCCEECAYTIKRTEKCPICRSIIINIVNRDDIE